MRILQAYHRERNTEEWISNGRIADIMAPLVGRSSDSHQITWKIMFSLENQEGRWDDKVIICLYDSAEWWDEPVLWTRETEEGIVAFKLKACTPGSISLE